ncbi:unnamed protein product [Caenorhabditis sp. 36 PRJEB53466]|nr:unnamed protein product [Caenorhabditis sp. 36 PRJEB53466]
MPATYKLVMALLILLGVNIIYTVQALFRYERSMKSVFEEFERKLRKRQGDRKTEALNEFDDLSRKPGQMMWEFLVDVEK